MPLIVPVRLPATALNQTVTEFLSNKTPSNTPDQSQIVNTQLNAVLKSQLTASATNAQQTALAKLLATLAPGDFSTDQNLSLRAFVTKYTASPPDPAVSTLSSTTTVGAFLGLDVNLASNPALSGIVAQTDLATLLRTSPALATDQLALDFVASYVAFQGTTQEFWAQLSQDAEFKTAVPELQFTFQLAVVADNSVELVKALRTAYKPASLSDLAKMLDAPTLSQLITSQGIAVPANIAGATPAEQLTNYVNGMIDVMKTAFPTVYMAKRLAASKDATLQLVATVLSNAPDIDLRSTNIDAYLTKNAAKAFQNVPPEQVAATKNSTMALRRVVPLATNDSTATALLAEGFDSASKIAALSQTAFVNQVSSVLGGVSQAQVVYEIASHVNAQALLAFRTIQSGLREISPRAIASTASSVTQAIQQQIPTWEVLFGPTSSCECGECGSVYGAAAYFTDLLQFLGNSKKNAMGFSPLDVLIGGRVNSNLVLGRRPDLPYIKLNCQNTNTLLPYIDLVNEILESYIAQGETMSPVGGTLSPLTAQNTPSDATADELAVNPEYTIDAAYTALSAATYPLSLPYDRFLDVARRYLAFLGGNRRQVIQLFQTPLPPVDAASVLAAETLGLSDMEVKLIADWNIQSGSPDAFTNLSALYAGNTPITDSSNSPKPFETWIASVPIFLRQTGLAFADLINLLETQFVNPGQTITLQGANPCDLTTTTIASLNLVALTRILSFLRLWKKLGWSMSDLDKVIHALVPTEIDRRCLLALADVTQLQAQLNLSFPQLMGLWSAIDTDGRDSLYITLFQNKAVLNPVAPAFRLTYRAILTTGALPAVNLPTSVTGQATYDQVNQRLLFTGAMTDEQRSDLITWAATSAAASLAVQILYEMRWAQGTEIVSGGTITDNVSAILAALRISADDLNAIRIVANLADTGAKTPLNLANLSQLYRYAIFAQALGVSIPDLISLISLTGVNPFRLAQTDSAIAPAMQFIQAVQAVLASPFTLAQLNYIYRAIANPAAGVGPLEADVNLLVLTLKTSLGKVAAANASTLDPSGKLLRKQLGVILGSVHLTAAMDLIDGIGVYTSSLTALPNQVAFNGDLAALILYDSANQLLRFNGAMTDATLGNLNGLSTDVSYRNALSDLYQQPRAILAANLSFLKPTDALTNLINSRSPDAASRYSWVLENYLTDSQSRSLVQQTLSQALALDADTTALLLSGGSGSTSPAILKSQRDSTQDAIVDLLDVRDGGLLATYFSDLALTAVTATNIDATVNVGPAGTSVPNPGGVRWRGKVLAEFTESYTFYVAANDGVRLWVGDQLLIDQWIPQAVSTRTSPPVNLNAGQLYDLRLEYFNASSGPSAVLEWSSKSTSANASVAIPQSALFPENTFLTLSRLYPIGVLLSTFAMKSAEVDYLSSHATDFAGTDPGNAANTVAFDLSALPLDRSDAAAVDRKSVAFFHQWLQLNDLFVLRKSLPAGNVTLFDIFRSASSSTAPTRLGTATVSAVLAATGWDAGEFATLSGRATVNSAVVGFGLSDADFVNAAGRNSTGLVWLKKCVDLGARLGVPASHLFSWANTPPSPQQANDIRNTVKAKYDDATWVTVGTPLSNQIRDNSRAALTAYVLNLPTATGQIFSNADQLYEYFLIDVQMSSCMQTSRIVQATAAIQLFVQRCLLNLENATAGMNLFTSVGADAIDAAQWEWRKNYRVWEANRQVFLYPENWIDPTLRDDRTPFFKDLQAELQRGEVTADLAEQAFQNYLQSLQEVARLDICGFHWEQDTDPDTQVTHDIYHVFARTFSSPHVYFYRQFDNLTQIWSPWEKVDIDIQGDHLIPVIWNRRLYLFWPIFREQTTPVTAAAVGVTVPSGGQQNVSPQLPVKSLQVQLAWSEYRNGAWTKKQVTVDSLTPSGFTHYRGTFDPGILTFQALPAEAGLIITVYCGTPRNFVLSDLNDPRFGGPVGFPDFSSTGSDVLYEVGQISFSGCSTTPAFEPEAISDFVDKNFDGVPKPSQTVFYYMNVVSIGANSLTPTALVRAGAGFMQSPVPVLQSTPTARLPYTLCYPQELLLNESVNDSPPFFYADDDSRTYLAKGIAALRISGDPSDTAIPFTRDQLNPAVSSLPLMPRVPVFETQAVTGSLPVAAEVPATGVSDTALARITAITQGAPSFRFATHYHPHVSDFVKALNWQGVPGLLTLDNQKADLNDVGNTSRFFTTYNPADCVSLPYPSEAIDFSPDGAYSLYNWEIFFHIPFLIATQLSQNQQFEAAEKWFRYIFNPGSNSTDEIPQRYWNVLPFWQKNEFEAIGDLVASLDYTGSDSTILGQKANFEQQVTAWQDNPFDPDLIARMRIVAYKKAIVMRYIDHHLSWADFLFRQFTRESVNEATLHYVLCKDLLGDKPIIIPPHEFVADKTYHDLASLDKFSDALVQMEDLFPFSAAAATSSASDTGASSASSVATVLYFCVPPNDKLLGYWDTVDQRLFQIRHCMNIAGQVQTLPLFAPPIDPGLLVRALAMGMDLTSALNDINAATPFYRFAYILPKALELCAEVRSLGASSLSALEKSDAEGLSMLRATQETALMKAVRNVKQQQLKEANSNVDALNDSLAVTTFRQQHYQSLLTVGLSSYEQGQILHLNQAQVAEEHSHDAQLVAAALSILPTLSIGINGVGGSPKATLSSGGSNLGGYASVIADWYARDASKRSSQANLSGLTGGFDRRNEEWNFQLESATLEIQQINDQITAATARVAAAQADLDNQDLQISNSSDIEQYLRTKYTNQALYDWMVGQVSSVYFQCYQMAYDLAKRAEACFVFERMPDVSSYTPFIQFGYWDNLKKGLLSGECLYQDLKRLEIAYMDQNQRDYEITKSISLLLLDPMALINLKETGQCTVQFPEALFDMDYPGHYLRRVKSIGITIPCVVGPYTSVNCTLTLATNKIRANNIANDAKDYVKDSHYVTNFAAAESIATSSAQNDSGLFMVNFNDERYLPFEGAGVISTWQLSMPLDTNAFDFETITDVIFNLKYTARDGGSVLRGIAKAAAVLPPPSTPGATVQGDTALANQTNLTRMFSLRHEFPSDWHAFLHPPDSAPDQTMTINLTQERFPFQYRGKKIQIYQVDVFLKFRNIFDPVKYTADGTPLGDYAVPLTLNLTPPTGTTETLQLLKNTAILSGVPYGSVPALLAVGPPLPLVLGGLGNWTLVARGADVDKIAVSLQTQLTSLGNTYSRLAIDVIEDALVVFRFAVG